MKSTFRLDPTIFDLINSVPEPVDRRPKVTKRIVKVGSCWELLILHFGTVHNVRVFRSYEAAEKAAARY